MEPPAEKSQIYVRSCRLEFVSWLLLFAGLEYMHEKVKAVKLLMQTVFVYPPPPPPFFFFFFFFRTVLGFKISCTCIFEDCPEVVMYPVNVQQHPGVHLK